MAKVILAGGPSFSLSDPSLHVSLGLLYLAGSLRAAGHDVKIVDCHRLTSWNNDRHELTVHRELLEPCDVLGLSTVTPNIDSASALAVEWPAKYKVVGGPHVTYILDGPHDRYKTKEYFRGFDFMMTGEAEHSLVQFCNGVDKGIIDKNVPGLCWFNELGWLQKNPPPPMPEVDQLPQPAYDLWEGSFHTGGLLVKTYGGKAIDKAERKVGSLFTTRGCPYGCYFCADARTKMREETFAQIESEVKTLASMGVTSLRIWDDTITIKDKRCRQLADLFYDYGMIWKGWSRVNLTNPELFKYLASKGCTEMGFGVEHGSARMLKAMNKGTTPQANELGIKLCQDSGVLARSYLIIGFPGETHESIDEMQRWLDLVRPNAASLHIFQPYPGSDVWKTPEKFNVELPVDAFSKMWEFNDNDPSTFVLDLPTMSRQELFKERSKLLTWITETISLKPVNV